MVRGASATRCRMGRHFYGEEPFHILETRVPASYAERLHFDPNLDSIGPRATPKTSRIST